MIPGRIENATRYLGAPKGWEPDRDGHCAHLAILDVPADSEFPAMMQSVWEPTPDELARIAAGAKVVLVVVGSSHPPVALSVGDIPA